MRQDSKIKEYLSYFEFVIPSCWNVLSQNSLTSFKWQNQYNIVWLSGMQWVPGEEDIPWNEGSLATVLQRACHCPDNC